MGFGDALKKKLMDVAKAAEQAIDGAQRPSAAPPKPTVPNQKAAPDPVPERAPQPEPDDVEDDAFADAATDEDADEKEFQAPPGWSDSELTPQKFWATVFQIDAVRADEAKLRSVLSENGFDSLEQYDWIRARYADAHGSDQNFMQAALDARLAQNRNQLQAALKPGLLEPIEGVSLETYATIQAKRTQLPPSVDAFGKLLAHHGMDEVKWARVDQGWMARMSDAADPTSARAVNTEYARYFAAAGVGQFGAGAQAAAATLGGSSPVGAASGGEPCTFERYVEIMTAQSCWADAGQDVNAMLQSCFQMSAVDYSNLSAYWTQKMMTDMKLMTEVMPALQAKYQERYAAPDQDDDLAV